VTSILLVLYNVGVLISLSTLTLYTIDIYTLLCTLTTLRIRKIPDTLDILIRTS